MRPLIYSLPMKTLQENLVKEGQPKFAAEQVYHWIYKMGVIDPEEWSNVAKKTKSYLTENYDFTVPKVVWHGLSKDGTRKFLIGMRDGQTIETVAIPANDRLTLCISSQVGCAIGCTFCHTGTQGLKRHLEAGEIAGQFLAVTLWLKKHTDSPGRLTNIVYMGQGEPLHNYDAVKAATQIVMEPKGFGIGQRKITLSTSGLVPQIEKLWDFPPVNIAISLHAAHDNIRTELMPINKAYDLERLFKAIRTIPLKATRRITYEYLLIKELNDRQEDIDGLVELLDIRDSKVNLIPFNEYPGSDFKRPDKSKVKWFQNALIQKGFTCTVRSTKGDDILAACGQLKSAVEDKVNTWEQASV